MDDIIPQDAIPLKCCPKCPEGQQWHPATTKFFHSNKSSSDGLAGWCKVCRYTYNKVPPEKNRITQRKYDRAHTEEKRRYTETDACKTRARNFRARRRQAKGTHTAQDIQKQYANQKGRCYYCHTKISGVYHIDHVIPLSRGGTNWPDNLVIACPSCNRSKYNKLPHEWAEGGNLL